MSFTLTTLTQSIQDWTENDESTFVAEIPFFIKNAEERIFKTVDLDYFRKNVEGTATSGNKFLQKPSDYMATFSLSLSNSGSSVFLLQKDVNFIQEFNFTSYKELSVLDQGSYFIICCTKLDDYFISEIINNNI